MLGSRPAVSRITQRYVPYPRLRVNATSHEVHSCPVVCIRKCMAPFSSTQALEGSYRLKPPRWLGALRTLHSYPPKTIIGEGGFFAPDALITARTSPSVAGRASIEGFG